MVFLKCVATHLILSVLIVLVADNKILTMLLALESQMEVLRANTDTAMDSDVKFMAAASDLADRELVMTISWAKQVPGESIGHMPQLYMLYFLFVWLV